MFLVIIRCSIDPQLEGGAKHNANLFRLFRVLHHHQEGSDRGEPRRTISSSLQAGGKILRIAGEGRS